MATAQDATQQATDPSGDQQQVTNEDPSGDPQMDYKQRYAALKTDYDKLVTERKETKQDPSPPKGNDGDLEWIIFNADRIKVCKQEFDSLRKEGMKPEKALEYAEKIKGTSKSSSASSREASVPPTADTIIRDDDQAVDMSEFDRMLGVKPETKKKYRSFVEGGR